MSASFQLQSFQHWLAKKGFKKHSKVASPFLWEKVKQYLAEHSCEFQAGPLIPAPPFDFRDIPSENPEKKTVLVHKNDNPSQKPIAHRPDQVILPTSLKRGNPEMTVVMPAAWGINIYKQSLAPLPEEKDGKPRIGFCGYFTHDSRRRTCQHLASIDAIECDFVVRDIHYAYWGLSLVEKKRMTGEFRQNMAGNHFNLCNRGSGYHSLRLFETLSAGRIPAMLRTDSVLPFEGLIDWEEHIVLAETEQELSDKILAVWRDRDMVQVQQDCRALYDEYFSPESLPRHLLEMLNRHYSSSNGAVRRTHRESTVNGR